jgi:hypothetical protein
MEQLSGRQMGGQLSDHPGIGAIVGDGKGGGQRESCYIGLLICRQMR